EPHAPNPPGNRRWLSSGVGGGGSWQGWACRPVRITPSPALGLAHACGPISDGRAAARIARPGGPGGTVGGGDTAGTARVLRATGAGARAAWTLVAVRRALGHNPRLGKSAIAGRIRRVHGFCPSAAYAASCSMLGTALAGSRRH